ncbi:carbohydrate sulfotransferase 9-like [Mytilus californianus]|uniref:carbohydrate sulfotransferase 9-like n=1 Tax=Mytilus californianus TaxID=6549 RepID=UPI002246FA02|nr:carbohydrate sulfotransferase 9-like [Mytilus californianus]
MMARRSFLMIITWCGIFTTLNLLLMFKDIKTTREYMMLYLSNIKITTNNFSYVMRYEDHKKKNIQSTKIKENSLKDGYQFPKHLCYSETFNESKMNAVFKGSIMPIYKHQLAYCRVYKGGSTFWRRLLHCLDKDLKVSPFSIKPQDEKGKYRRTCAMNSMNWTYNMLRVTKSFMFARNPYSRILSAYIDKLYSPNPYFWKTLGVVVMKTIRNKTSCGSDVTFRSLVEYIIQTPIENLDDHFIPISSICRPCNVQYHYIGKMETLPEDVRRFLGFVGYYRKNFNQILSRPLTNLMPSPTNKKGCKARTRMPTALPPVRAPNRNTSILIPDCRQIESSDEESVELVNIYPIVGDGNDSSIKDSASQQGKQTEV